MKKLLFSAVLMTALASATQAQMSTGGLPLSMQKGKTSDYIPVTMAMLPDWSSGLKKWEAQAEPKPYLVALMTPTDMSFPNSGVLYTLEGGSRIWRAQIKVEGAYALGLYYDNFHLPEGVKYYLSNSNGRQILGAYTAANNDPANTFANEAVEGSVINLEFNIEPGVNLSDIKLHIDRAAVYYRGIEHLAAYQNLQTIDAWDSQLTGGSSVCMINAVCPLGTGYAAQRNATFQTLVPMGGGVGSCTSTMINTAANTPANCKQYFLLATHCEFSNAITDAGFSQIILRFNYQQNVCNPPANTIPNTQQTMTGAKFVSRAILPVNAQGAPIAQNIKGDFLLLELKNALPDSWGVNLAGWNNSTNIPLTTTTPKKFIDFHHPGADVKKVSTSHVIQSTSIGAANTHWAMTMDSGLVAEGTSGSALFDGDGRIIGVASVAPLGAVPAACATSVNGHNVAATTSSQVNYSKFSYCWDYSADGNTDNRKLKPWLDPDNSAVTTVNAVKSNCTALDGGTSITNHNKLDDGIMVFPNPSNTGKIILKVNLIEATDLSIDLVDISGKKVNEYKLAHVNSGNYVLDVSGYSNGVYLLKLTDGYQTASRKIMLSR